MMIMPRTNSFLFKARTLTKGYHEVTFSSLYWYQLWIRNLDSQSRFTFCTGISFGRETARKMASFHPAFVGDACCVSCRRFFCPVFVLCASVARLNGNIY